MNLHVPDTQAGRMMAAQAGLGTDVLLPDALDVEETVDGLFAMRPR